MGLFGRGGQDENRTPKGNWHEDPLNRFDARLMVATGPRTREWGAHVRLGQDQFRDPLPPRFTLSWADDAEMMKYRTRSTLSGGKFKDRGKSLGAATGYYDDKVMALLQLAAPGLPAVRRQELDSELALAMTISGEDYLNAFMAAPAAQDAFKTVVETGDPRRHLAWFWDVDDWFQMPQFHDDLIFRGGQLILEKMGAQERAFVGVRPSGT